MVRQGTRADGRVDALPQGRVRGRGAGLNPGNRFDGLRLHVLDDHLERQHAEHPDGVQVATTTVPDRTRRIINYVDSPDLSFSWTINPYRGCSHGCTYCYARPTHEMLGYSCGLDFETKIMVKHDAPRLLRRELADPRWKPDPIVMSGVTDPYQPEEAEHCVTRGCLEVMAKCGQPVGVVTKNRMVTRDIDQLSNLARMHAVRLAVSVTTLDNDLARTMEPRASSPRDRLAAIRTLADAGIPVQVMVAPIIPGLNDEEIPAILEAVADAGASHATWVLLRLPHQVKDLFLEWLHRELPLRAGRVEHLIRQTRSGSLNDTAFGRRMRGDGAIADGIRQTFKVFAHRLGLDGHLPALSSASFRRPVPDGQLELF